MRHVNQHLAAYSQGLLDKKQERLVRDHIARCPDCFEAVAHHEQLGRDLKLALGQNPVPRREQVMQWWLAIQAGQTVTHPLPATRSWTHLAALPTFIMVFILFLPVAIGLVGNTTTSITMHPTIGQPGVQVTLAPPTDLVYATQEPPNAHIRTVAYTTSAAPEPQLPDGTTIPVIPAPVAP